MINQVYIESCVKKKKNAIIDFNLNELQLISMINSCVSVCVQLNSIIRLNFFIYYF